MSLDLAALTTAVQKAVAEGKLTQPAADNIRIWLNEPRYAGYAESVAEHIAGGMWKQLDDAFWTVIPFGTGGRRGKMYPIGCNAINDRTIGESAQGLATYVKKSVAPGTNMACAIGYDTRHRSREFAELCAEVMVANGFQVYFLDGYRSTPEVSYTVRYKNCCCGIMVTASHNPPSDNAVKAYWAGGVQVLPPHDKGVINEVMACEAIARTPFAEAVKAGKVTFCQEECDASYIQAVLSQSFAGPRDLKIIYSPLHGVGAATVMPILERDGFKNVELFGPHAEPNGDFPNVPGHVSNPENPQVFDAMIERAKQTVADIILATDPDADRVGVAAQLTPGGAWKTINGNQIGVLLVDYVLERRKAAGSLGPQNYVVKTLVTTEMIRRIADSYGVKTMGNLHVGFKWIGRTIDAEGPAGFVFGSEESHGYLTGVHARDKDAAVAAMLLAELAARVKAEGKTLHQKLESLSWQHGCHVERLYNQSLPGSEGMATMRKLMEKLRTAPPKTLGGLKVRQARDFLTLTTKTPTGETKPLDAEKADMIMLDFEQEGNYVAVRPSGTEPKVKYYMFAYEPAEQLANLDDTQAELEARLTAIEKDFQALAASL
ncbi:MAG: phospho-sugar mutase [Planctomycetaceae bacterium]|nr:phospho-sugar mutase [Planctomycetaceae bacterium]